MIQMYRIVNDVLAKILLANKATTWTLQFIYNYL